MKRHGVHSRTCEVKTAHCRRAPTLRFLKREAEIAKHTLVSEGEEAALLGAGICTALALRTPKINNQTKAGVGGGATLEDRQQKSPAVPLGGTQPAAGQQERAHLVTLRR